MVVGSWLLHTYWISDINHQEDRSFDAHDHVECELGFQQRWILTKLQSLTLLISALTLLWKPGKVAVMTEYLHFHRWTPKIELLQYLKLQSLFSRELHLELTSAYCSTWADCQSHSSDPDHPFLLSIFSLSDCWEDCVIVSSWGLQSLWRDSLLAAHRIKQTGRH